METVTPTVGDIIERCGGVAAIVHASSGGIGRWAPYKWAKTGIPEPHWHLIRHLSGASADDLHRANEAARGRPGDEIGAGAGIRGQV